MKSTQKEAERKRSMSSNPDDKKPSGRTRRKTTPKAASGKGRKTAARKSKKPASGGKKGWLKKLAVLGAKLSLVGLAVIIVTGIYLDSQVRSRFDGQLWELPAVVYGRVMYLANGEPVTIKELRKELDLLNYKKVRNPVHPGEFSASSTRIEMIRRPFEFEDGSEPARHVMVSFDAHGVTGLKMEDSGKQLGFLRIEPKLLGMLESGGEEQRLFLPRERFPELLVEALLTTEDRDFYQHEGVSLTAIARAAVANLRAGRTVQGGSTLTQQLAKNLFLTRDKTLWRKIREAYIALIIDYRYSKDRILEAYLNEVYVGQNQGQAVHGFPLAARLYFGRPIQELTVDQLALLVGMVKGPSYYNPWRFPERALERRDLVLKLMLEANLLTGEQYNTAASRPLGIKKKPSLSTRQPAYFDLLRTEIKERVGDHFNPDSGLRVFSTLDPLSQKLAEEAVVEKVPALSKRAGKGLEAAVVIADRQSGEIRAMVGGNRPGYAGFNRALYGSRQVGSLAKPPVYLAALSEPDKFSLVTPLPDKPITLKGSQGSVWTPRNYDRKFRGEVPLMDALAKSLNVPTVNLGMAVGLDKVINIMTKLGVPKGEVPRLPSILLGAYTLTPYQVTQMYQSIGSGGREAPLTALRSVVTQQGEVLYRNWPKSREVVSQQAAWLTVYAMKKAVKEGTARYLNPSFGWAGIAGKTGTTDNNRDSWFVGIDGREVVTVWLGKDDNKSTGLTGSSGALRVYASYMQKRQPEPLQLTWPKQVTTLPFALNGGEYSLDCGSKVTFPVWDKSGKQADVCKSSSPVGWVKDLFSW